MRNLKLSIRPYDPSDAPAAVALARELLPYEPVTEARLRQYEACVAPRLRERRWVLEEGGRLVGWAVAGLHMWTGDERVGSFFVGVHPAFRGSGRGSLLFDEALAHVADLRPARAETSAYGPEPATERFLLERGFTQVRQAQVWTLRPEDAAIDDTEKRERQAHANGLQIRPLAAFADRPEAMHALYSATLRDVPSESSFTDVRYEEFLCYRLRDPMLSAEGSFVVSDGDLPVAYAWLTTDGAGLGFNAMTGTIPEYRHRGLAKLAKAVGIRWAREHGIRVLYTSNDFTNADMLGLNRSLGYQPIGLWQTFSRPMD